MHGVALKPLKKVASAATKNISKPLAKKALTSGIVPTGKKIGEKSGDHIMKNLFVFVLPKNNILFGKIFGVCKLHCFTI